jgi:hypothetical protein
MLEKALYSSIRLKNEKNGSVSRTWKKSLKTCFSTGILHVKGIFSRKFAILLLVPLASLKFSTPFLVNTFLKYNHIHVKFSIIRCSPVVSCVNKNNPPWIKDAQLRYLVCALICTGKISLCNSAKQSIFDENGTHFSTVHKLLWNKSSVNTVAWLVKCFVS